MKRLASGFTLIEILVVTTIIALLVGLGINSYTQFNKQARDAKRKADVENIRAAIEMYKSNDTTYNSYPATFAQLTPYLRDTSPDDPRGTPYPTLAKSPAGCNGADNVCTNYTISTTLESSGATYTCNNLGCQ